MGSIGRQQREKNGQDREGGRKVSTNVTSQRKTVSSNGIHDSRKSHREQKEVIQAMAAMSGGLEVVQREEGEGGGEGAGEHVSGQSLGDTVAGVNAINQGPINKHVRNTTFTQIQKAVKKDPVSLEVMHLCLVWKNDHQGKLSGEYVKKAAVVASLLDHCRAEFHESTVQVSRLLLGLTGLGGAKKDIEAEWSVCLSSYDAVARGGEIPSDFYNKVAHRLYRMLRLGAMHMGALSKEKKQTKQEENADVKSAEKLEEFHCAIYDVLEHISVSTSGAGKESASAGAAEDILKNSIVSMVSPLMETGHENDARLVAAHDAGSETAGNLEKIRGVDDSLSSFISLRAAYGGFKDFTPASEGRAYKKEKLDEVDTKVNLVEGGESVVKGVVNATQKSGWVKMLKGLKTLLEDFSSAAGAHGENVSPEFITKVEDGIVSLHSFIETNIVPGVSIVSQVATLVSSVLDFRQSSKIVQYLYNRPNMISEEESGLVDIQKERRWDAVFSGVKVGLSLIGKFLHLFGATAPVGVGMSLSSSVMGLGKSVKTKVMDGAEYDSVYTRVVDKVLMDVKALPEFSRNDEVVSKYQHAAVELSGLGVGSVKALKLRAMKSIFESEAQKRYDESGPSMVLRDYLVDMQKGRAFKKISK